MAERDHITTESTDFHPLGEQHLLSVLPGVSAPDALWEASLLMDQSEAVLRGLAGDLEMQADAHSKCAAALFILGSAKAILDSVHVASVARDRQEVEA